MAGLWERVKNEAEDRVAVHLIEAAFGAYYVNTVDGSKGATAAQILTAINNQLETPLDAASQTDLSDIAAEIDALANNTQKLIYLVGLKYVFIAAEMGEVNETKWRNDLGI